MIFSLAITGNHNCQSIWKFSRQNIIVADDGHVFDEDRNGIHTLYRLGSPIVATLAENKFVWDGDYDWPKGGDEWSGPWGGPAMQWYAEILPRIHSHVRGRRVLEIACGYGRWTQFLNEYATELTLVDLSQECIDACRKRFGADSIRYHVNDGTSLEMIESNSIDFIFSYDSLVHADAQVVKSYLSQFKRILSDEGAGFIHHSNLGEYIESNQKLDDDDVHWRDPTVSASRFAQQAKDNGLCCIAQELIGWDSTVALIDCYSTFVKQTAQRARDNIIYRNPDHQIQTRHIKNLSHLYAAPQQ